MMNEPQGPIICGRITVEIDEIGIWIDDGYSTIYISFSDAPAVAAAILRLAEVPRDEVPAAALDREALGRAVVEMLEALMEVDLAVDSPDPRWDVPASIGRKMNSAIMAGQDFLATFPASYASQMDREAAELPWVKALVGAASEVVNSVSYDARTMAPLYRAIAAVPVSK